MEYNFREIEKKWQKTWEETNAYKVQNDFSKPKYYVLDMFPYPSGAGLHVGHPLGYISTDIFARYKRLKGYNVLHPMGYDAFGLPAEQYAIEHGVHPAISTEQNINNFRKQLDNIGFCFDWSREVRTSEPSYYKWTQWIFLQLFKSWYNISTNKAEYIADTLIPAFEKEGSKIIDGRRADLQPFTAEEWKSFSAKEQGDILMQFRLAFCDYGIVNWCEALGTVLANDEVINGVSERGGYPVEKKKLRQWYLRITEYADRLLEGLQRVDFSDAMKEMQTNWIGRSQGAEIAFEIFTPNSETRKTPINTAIPEYYQILKEHARENRKNQTVSEDILWQRLRNNQLGEKVRRQHPIQGYIADFAFLNSYLVVEIDGDYHNEKEQKIYDDARTKYLGEFGYKIVRFTHNEVENNTNEVIKTIKTALDEQHKTSSQPSPQGEGAIDSESPLSSRRGVGGEVLTVYTTRPDTIFGVDFMVIAPELELIDKIKSEAQTEAVDEYVAYVKSRSERERQAEKKISGCFTGAYAINPFNGKEIPIWTAEYVLAGYGTGAVMAVPCGDERDYKFAKQFDLPITNILGEKFDGENANATKDAILENSDFVTVKPMKEATEVILSELEKRGIGKRKVNFRMRDAAFSRQRFWGEPIPIKWIDGVAIPLNEKELPLQLPEVDSYKPGPEGQGPLANVKDWTDQHLETNTMPGYAGSSWYFLRYMDPHNDQAFCERNVSDYWNQVDLYLGGTEHAVGHLLYSRLWTKILFDLGYLGFDEPYKRLVNQGMIQGSSRFVYRLTLKITSIPEFDYSTLPQLFISRGIVEQIENNDINGMISSEAFAEFNSILQTERKKYSTFFIEPSSQAIAKLHVDVNIVDGYELDTEAFKKWKPEFANAEFILENGKYITTSEVEKMSKSKFNTVNPDELVNKYGADTFRMYEMFLGPVEQSKPWETKGIEGVHRFLKKLWRLVFDENKGAIWTEENPTDAELKTLHKTIKKVGDDIERLSLNTAVSAFMVAVNELSDLKCHKRAVIEPLLILLTPYAPHVAEELWQIFGNTTSILDAAFPTFEEKYLKESTKNYPVSINGKMRTNIEFALDADKAFIEETVLKNEIIAKWLEGQTVKKFIFVPGKMINVVI